MLHVKVLLEIDLKSCNPAKAPKDIESSYSHRYKQPFDTESLPLTSQLRSLNIKKGAISKLLP